MEAIQVLAGVVASVLAFDVGISVMAACEHRAAWKGFKVTKNGWIYNVEAKRFATKAEKVSLFAVTYIL